MDLSRIYFLNRLRALQWLCSDSDSNYPKGLLFIPGSDGRSNSASIKLLKYLFKGSVGKYLFDENLEEELESLEDVVILIKESSVSIIYSENMKKLLSPMIYEIPRLIEYVYSSNEEDDIDLFQDKKCVNFKRMVLEGLSPGDSVGIAVPIGYDDILDIEGWPILQAFALDQVLAPTGFFTARYNVVDITEHLETLFRTVDCYYVDNAIQITKSVILPHMNQMLGAIDAPTISQRDKITGDDVIGPLEILYEFGELDLVVAQDDSHKPVALIGPYSSFIGNIMSPKASNWKSQKIENNLHLVIESSEPSSGIRWCRTFFLSSGTGDILFSDIQRLRNDLSGVNIGRDQSADDEEDEIEVSIHDITNDSASSFEISVSKRLHGLYLKLCYNLRRVVHEQFLQNSDVLEAGSKVQETMSLLFGKSQEDDNFKDLILKSNEKLQLHMDCMNALGEVVGVEDVDDMGGVCWTYIRASVNGIVIDEKGTLGSVAVGDTYLFSPLQLIPQPAASLKPKDLPTISDSVCVTYTLPYFQNLLGKGPEDDYTRLVRNFSKSSALSPLLGIGKLISVSEMSNIQISVISNHPMNPSFEAEMKGFTNGFILDKINGINSVPITINFTEDVETVWNCSFYDYFTHILASNDKLADSVELPTGFLMIFSLKKSGKNFLLSSFEKASPAFFPNDFISNHYLAICIQTGDRINYLTSTLLDYWKVAMRTNEVLEKKGKSSDLPICLELPFLALLESWSLKDKISFTSAFLGDDLSISRRSMDIINNYYVYHGLPSYGTLAMRCQHSLSEAQRLSSFDFLALAQNSLLLKNSPSKLKSKANSRFSTIAVAGLLGQGIETVANQLFLQLSKTLKREFELEFIEINFTDLISETKNIEINDKDQLIDYINRILRRVSMKNSEISSKPKLLFVKIVLVPLFSIKFIDLLTMITSILQTRILNVSIVTNPKSIFSSDREYHSLLPIKGVGTQFMDAISKELLFSYCCDTVIVVDSNMNDSYYSYLRKVLDHINPSANLIKLQSTNIYFTEDHLLPFVTSLEISDNNFLEREVSTMYIGFPSPSQQQSLGSQTSSFDCHFMRYHAPKEVPNNLKMHSISPLSIGIARWSLESILRLIQFFFPHSKTGVGAIVHHWSSDCKNPKTGFARMLQLASAKVFSEKRQKFTEQQFLKRFTDLKAQNKDLIQFLRSGLHSITGSLIVYNEGFDSTLTQDPFAPRKALITIEANTDYIVLKEIKEITFLPNQSTQLIVTGIMDKECWSLCEDLFKCCESFVLSPKRLLTLDDFTKYDHIRIQNLKSFKDKPLPAGWWYDGHFFMDFQGNYHEVRPDINEIIEEYLHEENKHISLYNSLLNDVSIDSN